MMTMSLVIITTTMRKVVIALAPVVQTMDSAVHRINHYPANKHQQNQLSYPVNSDLSSG